MLNKILHFIKYNNATIIILAVILILGGGVLAAGPENIGERRTSVEGVDNTALLAADLTAFNMDFKIENIQQDEKYYYITYSFLDLGEVNNAWQYQLNQKTQKVSKKIKEDVGVYMVKFMAKYHEARIRELGQEKSLAKSAGEQKRVEVTEYSGLIGRTLDLAAKVFPGYEPIKKRELPGPENIIPPTPFIKGEESVAASGADNLTKIYNDYITAHPDLLNSLQATTTPEQTTNVVDAAPTDSINSAPADSTGSPQAIPEPTSVEIIELPIPAEAPTPTPTLVPMPMSIDNAAPAATASGQ